ncbi:MAG: hypothetical protein ABR598_07680 [Candidatus Dormibacteria bacterium]
MGNPTATYLTGKSCTKHDPSKATMPPRFFIPNNAVSGAWNIPGYEQSGRPGPAPYAKEFDIAIAPWAVNVKEWRGVIECPLAGSSSMWDTIDGSNVYPQYGQAGLNTQANHIASNPPSANMYMQGPSVSLLLRPRKATSGGIRAEWIDEATGLPDGNCWTPPGGAAGTYGPHGPTTPQTSVSRLTTANDQRTAGHWEFASWGYVWNGSTLVLTRLPLELSGIFDLVLHITLNANGDDQGWQYIGADQPFPWPNSTNFFGEGLKMVGSAAAAFNPVADAAWWASLPPGTPSDNPPCPVHA